MFIIFLIFPLFTSFLQGMEDLENPPKIAELASNKMKILIEKSAYEKDIFFATRIINGQGQGGLWIPARHYLKGSFSKDGSRAALLFEKEAPAKLVIGILEEQQAYLYEMVTTIIKEISHVAIAHPQPVILFSGKKKVYSYDFASQRLQELYTWKIHSLEKLYFNNQSEIIIELKKNYSSKKIQALKLPE